MFCECPVSEMLAEEAKTSSGDGEELETRTTELSSIKNFSKTPRDLVREFSAAKIKEATI